MHRTLSNLSTQTIRRTNHLTRAESTTRNQTTTHLRPVIPTRVLVDLRSPAEFTPRHHRHILVQTPLMQIRNQGTQPLIKLGQMSILHAVEVVRMKVPAAKIQRDNPTASLHQTTRHQEMLQVPWSTIAEIPRITLTITLTHMLRLTRDIQCLHQTTGRQNVKGLLSKRVHCLQHATIVPRLTQSIHRTLQQTTVLKSRCINSIQHHVLLRRTRGTKCGIRDAQKSGMPRRTIRRMTGVGRQSHKRRHCSIPRTQQLRNRRAKGWPAPRRLLTLRTTRVTDEGIMIPVRRSIHRTQRHTQIHDPRQTRHVLADLNPRHIRRYRLKLTANLCRSLHLQVIHVLMPRGTTHVNHNHRFAGITHSRLLLRTQQLRQT